MSHPFRAESAAVVAEDFEYWGEAAVYRNTNGDVVNTRAIDRTADVIAFTPRARQTARTLDLMREAIPWRPGKGDTVRVGQLTYTILEDAASDDALCLVWTCRVSLSIGRTASLAFILAPPLCAAAVELGEIPVQPSLSFTLSAPAVWATVFAPVAATAAIHLPAPSVVASAVRTSGRAVGLDALLPLPAVTASATVEAAASAEVMLPPPAVSFAALLAATVGNAASLPAPSLSATAAVQAAPALAITLPPPSLAASAMSSNVAACAITLPAPALSASILVSSGRIADVAVTLPAPTVESVAVSTVSASAAVALPAPTLAANALAGIMPYAGFTLDAPAVAASAIVAPAAALALVLPPPSLSASSLLSVATVNAYALPAPVLAASATVASRASQAATLSTPSLAATAKLTLAPAAAFNAPLPSVSASALVAAAGSASFSLAIPSLSATATRTSASALAIHASSPPRFTINANVGHSATSASFTAPSGALLVVVAEFDQYYDGFGGGVGSDVTSISDSGGLTWTKRIERNYDAIAVIWTAVTSSSVARTVTLSRTSSGQTPITAKIYVVTGQHASPIGASGSGSFTTNSANPTLLTASYNNSLVFVAAVDWSAPGSPTSSNLTIDAGHIAGQISYLSGYRTANAGAVTGNIDAAGTAASMMTWVALEIRAA